jgi:hypothetical protein
VSKVLTNKGGPGGEERPIWFASCTKCGKKAVGDDGSGFSCEVRSLHEDVNRVSFLVWVGVREVAVDSERPIWFASCTKCGKKAVGDDGSRFSCEVRNLARLVAQHQSLDSLLLPHACSNLLPSPPCAPRACGWGCAVATCVVAFFPLTHNPPVLQTTTPRPSPPFLCSTQACGWSGAVATYRYVVALRLEDSSAASFATAFQEQAQKILEKSADELKVSAPASKGRLASVLFPLCCLCLRTLSTLSL